MIKYFTSTQAGAPVVGNNWGDLVGLLDACLVNGFNSTTATSLTSSGNVATLTFTSHNFVVGNVINVSGATPSGYNGDAVVTAITTTTVSYAVTGPLTSPATGTVVAKMSPLGFNIAYTDGAFKRAYQTTDTNSTNKPLLVVNANQKPNNLAGNAYPNSTAAKWANVGIVQSMSDINTITGFQAPYDGANPTRNWDGGSLTNQFGWAKWYWAIQDSPVGENGSPTNGNRPWCIIGDSRSFYLFICPVSPSSSLYYGIMTSYGFGECKTFKPSDTTNSWLIADSFANDYTSSNSMPLQSNYSSAGVAGVAQVRNSSGVGSNGKWLLTSYDNLTQGREFALSSVDSMSFSGNSAYLNSPNGPDYSIWMHTPIYLRETTGNMRGIMPGLAHILHSQPYPDRYVIPPSAANNNQSWIAISCAALTPSYSLSQTAQVAFQLTGSWSY